MRRFRDLKDEENEILRQLALPLFKTGKDQERVGGISPQPVMEVIVSNP